MFTDVSCSRLAFRVDLEDGRSYGMIGRPHNSERARGEMRYADIVNDNEMI